MVPLNYVFKNGDVAEIITSSRPGARPSLDWLSFVQSPRRQRAASSRGTAGRSGTRASHGAGSGSRRSASELGAAPGGGADGGRRWRNSRRRLSYTVVEDLYAAVGYGDLSAETVVRRLRGEAAKTKPKKRSSAKKDQGSLRLAISVGGVTDVMFRLSRCCAPVPGDAIVGLHHAGRGVTVHRADCPNVGYYARREPGRMTVLEWTLSPEAYFPVADSGGGAGSSGADDGYHVHHQRGTSTNIVEARVRTGGKPKTARFDLLLEVKDLRHLQTIMDRISALSDVLRVDRSRRG